MSTINACQCPIISPILRHINFQVIDGNRNIFLTQFKEQLAQLNILKDLNASLARNGFKGIVQPLNDTYFYCES